jgi:hypothetical protein
MSVAHVKSEPPPDADELMAQLKRMKQQLEAATRSAGSAVAKTEGPDQALPSNGPAAEAAHVQAEVAATAADGAATEQDDCPQHRTLLPANPARPSETPLVLPDGIPTARFETKQERAAAWAKYQRSLTPGASRPWVDGQDQRAKRAEKVPEHVLSQLVGLHEKTYYFNIWMSCNGSWQEVKGWEEHFQERKFGRKSTFAWLTDGQMMDVWKDRDVVDGLQDHCKSEHSAQNPQIRAHPKLKHLVKAKQFYVELEDHMVETVTNVMRAGVRMDFNLEGDAGKDIALEIVGKSKSSFTLPPVIAGSPQAPAQAQPAADATRHIATVEPVGGSALDPAQKEEAARVERMARFRLQEDEKEKKKKEKALQREKLQELRSRERDTIKQQRKDEAQTPAGRARIWLKGLDAHIRVSMDEAVHCRSTDSKLPKGLKQEYANSWSTKAASFKRARCQIEKLLNSELDGTNASFAKIVDKVEQEVKDFKGDIQRYKTLERGYVKTHEKKQKTSHAAEEAEADIA